MQSEAKRWLWAMLAAVVFRLAFELLFGRFLPPFWTDMIGMSVMIFVLFWIATMSAATSQRRLGTSIAIMAGISVVTAGAGVLVKRRLDMIIP